jgi:putative tryptophan/tyrosine transport system substrate-binding protein
VKRLRLGIALIAACCAVLLYSDKDQRHARASGIPRIAVVQYSSTLVLDDAVHGLLDYLAAHGYQAGRNIVIDRFNAENDMATNTGIAHQVVSGKYDFAFTVSTNCLQSVANANRAGRVKHVFGAVADPLAAKVGINPKDPLDHPRNMVGIGSLAPIDELLDAARRSNPRLRRIGLPWNPSQANSEMYTKVTREVAQRMGLELLEGSVDNTAAVGEVVSSLVAQGADMILMHGDMTVALAVDALVASARRGKIPVFSTMPATIGNGVLFAAGADYYEIGKLTGEVAVRVLDGADMSKIPVEYIMPKQYAVNRAALAGLKDAWRIPDDLIHRAAKLL